MRLPTEWKKAVVPIGSCDPSLSSGKLQSDQFEIDSTGFLITLEKSIFLITNRHVVEGSENSRFIRFNLTDDGQKKHGCFSAIVPLVVKTQTWWFHTNASIDLAVGVIPKPPELELGDLELKAFGEDLFKKTNELSEGEEVFFLGYPVSLLNLKSNWNQPMARSGIISLLPNYKKTEIEENIYFIEGWVFPGNSGGPVFLRPSMIQSDPESGVSVGSLQPASLIGVISSYIPYEDIAVSKQTGRARIIFQENSGTAIVIGVERILEIIRENNLSSVPKDAQKK